MRRKISDPRSATAIALITMASITTGSFAVHAAEPAALEEIIVTAEKRETNLQETPVAISAFTQDALERSSINNLENLQYLTPALSISDIGGFGQVYIRGIGSNGLGVGVDPSSALYVDGVYIARPSAVLEEMVDINRVEVLRGPQGTLYGRNATGGAINLVSNAPTKDLTLRGDLTIGRFDTLKLKATASGPLVEDRVLARVSAVRSKRDGDIQNLYNGQEVNDKDTYAGRAVFDITVTDDINIRLSGDFTRDRGTGPVNGVITYPQSMIDVGVVPVTDPYQVRQDSPLSRSLDHYGFSGTLTWDLDAVTFKSITAYRDSKLNLLFDNDSTEFALLHLAINERSKTFSQEFQLASSGDGPLKWLVGVYYFRENGHTDLGLGLNESGIVNPVAPFPWNAGVTLGQNISDSNLTNAYAAFAQASYAVTDALTITTGIRYSYEKKDHGSHILILDPLEVLVPGGILQDATITLDDNWKSWTPKFGLDYRVNDDTMIYASATRGFKSGGFNLGAEASFNPESVWSYEAGVKSTWLDGRVRTNLSAFYSDYSDLQVDTLAIDQNGQPQIIIQNAGKARIKGIEFETQAALAEGFEVDLTAAYLDAKYKVFNARTIDGMGNPTLRDLAGERMPNAPEFKLAFGAQYSYPVSDAGTLTLRGEYVWQDNVTFDTASASDTTQKSYGIVNARLTYASEKGDWKASIYGTNLANDRYYTSISGRPESPGLIHGNLGERRMYGLELSVFY